MLELNNCGGLIIPEKLRSGDRVEVIAPSSSAKFWSEEDIKAAHQTLEDISLNVTFSANIRQVSTFKSASVDARVADLHAAFENPEVKAILTFNGGFNTNQLLEHIDYALIARNPKIICGYSDASALTLAIRQKSKLVTYIGPHFSTFAIAPTRENTLRRFAQCLMKDEAFEIEVSSTYVEHPAWLKEGEELTIRKNSPLYCLREGSASGEILAGNLCTLALLQGTEWGFDLKDKILFLEEDRLSVPENVARLLHSILRQPHWKELRGIVFGRFEPGSGMEANVLDTMLREIPGVDSLPVIANVDFGHTLPMATIPSGGQAQITASKQSSSITITKH